MENFTPLFPEESKRTEAFRRVIIRKTLQLARENPDLEEIDLIEAAEREAQKICDLCVEASFEDDPTNRIHQYFMDEKVSQRHNHVGRFFVAALEGYLNEPVIKQSVYRVMAQSTEDMLGKKEFEAYTAKIKELLENGIKEGLSYNQVMELKAAKSITHEIIQLYWEKSQNTKSFEKKLKKQIHSALTKYREQKPEENFEVDIYAQEIYDYFLTALEKNLDPDNL